MFVLRRTMDNHEPDNNFNAMCHDLPGFGWMYEVDPSATTRSRHFNKTRKEEVRNINSENLPSQSLPSDISEPVNEFVSYSASTTPTTLAYVDVNSRTRWPIPPLAAASASSSEALGVNSQPYDDIASFPPTLHTSAEPAPSLSGSSLTSSLSGPSLPTGLNSEPFTGPTFGSVNSEGGFESSGAASSARSGQFTDLQDRDLFGTATSARDQTLSNAAPALFDQAASFGTNVATAPGAVQKRPAAAVKPKSPRITTGGGRSSEGSSKGNQEKRCPVCAKKLRRDLTRHMRIHEAVADFACPFPRKKCAHKHGQFNRPYEYKKHLMNYHFKLDDPASAKKAANLSSKLMLSGKCQCGEPFATVSEWINDHIGKRQCSLLTQSN